MEVWTKHTSSTCMQIVMANKSNDTRTHTHAHTLHHRAHTFSLTHVRVRQQHRVCADCLPAVETQTVRKMPWQNGHPI